MTVLNYRHPRAAAGRTFPFWHETVLAILLCALLIAAGSLDPLFVRWSTQAELFTHAWELALLAVPMTLIIITGGIDLSVGSTMALCAVVLGLSYEAGMPLGLASALAMLTGLAAGLLNGVFVAHVRVHPLIVTLATFSAYRGIAEGISLARPISGFGLSFRSLADFAAPAFIVLLAFFTLALSKTVLGRWLYAIGHNETASRYSGVPVARVKLLLYGLSGTVAAVAAILFVARRNTAKADIASGMELDVITAVVLGGTSIFGGRGNLIGTLLGILLIHETREFVSWHWQNDEMIQVVVGTLLIGSVLLNRLLTAHRHP